MSKRKLEVGDETATASGVGAAPTEATGAQSDQQRKPCLAPIKRSKLPVANLHKHQSARNVSQDNHLTGIDIDVFIHNYKLIHYDYDCGQL